MGNRPARVTEADVRRAVRGAESAGLKVAAVRVEPDGTVHVVVGEPAKAAVDGRSEWRL